MLQNQRKVKGRSIFSNACTNNIIIISQDDPEMIIRNKFEGVDSFLYLSDYIGQSGSCFEATTERVRAVWKNFQYILLKVRRRAYIAYICQAFINFFSYTRFCACKTILWACPHTWEIVLVKKQACMLLIPWYNGGNCTKLVFKPLTAKKALSFSVLHTAPFL